MIAYNFTFTQFVSNSWYIILGFFMICHSLIVTPTHSLWRNIIKLVKIPKLKTSGVIGRVFNAQKGYKVVRKMPSARKKFWPQFVYVYYGGDWDLPTMCSREGPQTHRKVVDGEKIFVPINWLSKPKYAQYEDFLSAFGVSRLTFRVMGRNYILILSFYWCMMTLLCFCFCFCVVVSRSHLDNKMVRRINNNVIMAQRLKRGRLPRYPTRHLR